MSLLIEPLNKACLLVAVGAGCGTGPGPFSGVGTAVPAFPFSSSVNTSFWSNSILSTRSLRFSVRCFFRWFASFLEVAQNCFPVTVTRGFCTESNDRNYADMFHPVRFVEHHFIPADWSFRVAGDPSNLFSAGGLVRMVRLVFGAMIVVISGEGCGDLSSADVSEVAIGVGIGDI